MRTFVIENYRLKVSDNVSTASDTLYLPAVQRESGNEGNEENIIKRLNARNGIGRAVAGRIRNSRRENVNGVFSRRFPICATACIRARSLTDTSRVSRRLRNNRSINGNVESRERENNIGGVSPSFRSARNPEIGCDAINTRGEEITVSLRGCSKVPSPHGRNASERYTFYKRFIIHALRTVPLRPAISRSFPNRRVRLL